MVVNAIFFSAALSGSRASSLFLLYTDPGAGALLWQLLLAALVGGAFYARLLIRQVKTRIAGLKKSDSPYQVSLNAERSSRVIK
jgi:hypothetical protein